LSDPENQVAFQSKLRLPAPSAAVGEPHSDLPAKSAAVDDGDNTSSSILASMFLICLIIQLL